MNATGVEQTLDIGADVIGSSGDKVGTVGYVVVRPPEMHITDIVVSTGSILGRDIVVPLDRVRSVAGGKVYLAIDKGELKTYPDYIAIHYTQPPAEWAPPVNWYYPPTNVLWPANYYPTESAVQVNAPPGTEGIRQGMDVESADGHKVGSVDALETDPHSGDIVAFIVKHGFIFTHDTSIPTTDVQGLRDGKVILRLSKDQAENLEKQQSQNG